MTDAAEQASWNPAFRPNSHQPEETVPSAKSQPRHFAQSASIHHVSEPDDSEFSPVQERESFEGLPKQGIDYTNSFPVVPEQSHIQNSADLDAPEPLPRSQAEDILAEGHAPTEQIFAQTDNDAAPVDETDNGAWGDDGDDFFGGTGGHDQTTTIDEDSKMAEEMPLVTHDESLAISAEPEIGWGDEAEGDDFFGNDTPDATNGNFANSHSAASTTSVAEALLGSELDGQSIEQSGADLSTMWSEALGDDDLLDEDENALDPSSFFEDDGEGFLDDAADPTSLISPPAPLPVADQSGQIKGFSATAGPQRYAPSQAATPYMPQGYQPVIPAAATPNLAFGTQPRPEVSKAQSFVDKSKGGYESPYDLPMDLRPKRQPAPRQASAPVIQGSTLPPKGAVVGPPSARLPPPTPSFQGPPVGASRSAPSSQSPNVPSKSSGFFEELPAVAKPSRPSSTTRFSPAPQPVVPQGPPKASQAPPPRPDAPNNPPTQTSDYGLVMPQRQLSFGDEAPLPSPPTQGPPKASNRYSPSPASQASQPGMPPAQGRYSSAPAPASAAPFQRAPSVGYVPQFQPRTSSPLARSTSISEDNDVQHKSVSGQVNGLGLQHGVATPEMSPTYSGMMQSPEKVPSETRATFDMAPPAATISPPVSTNQSGTVRRRRAPTVVKEYVAPSGDHTQDPLERWKGGPIFKFGPGGLVSSFPVETPRFSVGQSHPLYIVHPGEVKTKSAKQITPLEETIATFPGPLKAKGKKKEVLAWLYKHVEVLKARELSLPGRENTALAQNRHDERILLFRILVVLVENDGSLDAPAVATAIRDILVPPSPPEDTQVGEAPYGSEFASGITKSATLQPKPHITAVEDVEELRKLLLKGEREKAAWHAVDKNLWGHAMLISSTIQGETWKQVVHEFVRNEVKGCGNNTQALSALYDVFSGNWEESVDQLVSSSARSGFQMISKTGSASNQNALAGLDRWQETLALIVSNRTGGDSKALVSLGELLATYGRAEAAHICYIVAKVPGLFSGADDPQAHAVLLGANHRQQSSNFHKDIEAVLATEVYEFAVNILAGGSSTVPMVHLAPYKLQHAYILAEAGYRDEAQRYCEAITASLKASKMAPYLHAQLTSNLDDLFNRLSQTPREPSKSWLANPKMGNVSSSLLSSFNKFVSGDDSDNASTASGPTAETGPFGGLSGDPIALSRSASPAVIGGGYNGQPGYTPAAPNAAAGTRYAPGPSYSSSPSSSYTPASQHRDSSGSLPRMSPDHFRKIPTSSYQPQGAYTPTSGLSHAQSYSQDSSKPATAAPAFLSAIESETVDSRPSTSDGPMPPQTQRRTSYEPLSVPKLQRDRNSNAYQPRSTGSDSRGSSSYAPRSGSYAPRSYAPSPAASERLQPQAPPESSPSYTPQAPLPEIPVANEKEDAAPAEDEHSVEPEAPISFGGYDPSPSYGYQPSKPVPAEEPAAADTQPSYGYQPTESFTPTTFSHQDQNSANGYEPPTSSYEPSSFQPYQPDEPESPQQPRKKGIMDLDDDDDFGGRAEQLKKEEKARKDREAEDAFKRAAEADAARDNKQAAGQKKGWFGGWLGGKKEQEKALDQPTVHKAKLGEESSFVFDPELKKWVNKKGGAEATMAKTATPPPPKGGPPMRAASAMGPPRGSIPTSLPGSNSVPPSRNSSPLVNMKNPGDAASVSGSEAEAPVGATPPVGSGLAPPSRPSTGMSKPSSSGTGDDLLGSLGPRKGAAGKKSKKGGRYVDVMAK